MHFSDYHFLHYNAAVAVKKKQYRYRAGKQYNAYDLRVFDNNSIGVDNLNHSNKCIVCLLHKTPTALLILRFRNHAPRDILWGLQSRIIIRDQVALPSMWCF